VPKHRLMAGRQPGRFISDSSSSDAAAPLPSLSYAFARPPAAASSSSRTEDPEPPHAAERRPLINPHDRYDHDDMEHGMRGDGSDPDATLTDAARSGSGSGSGGLPPGAMAPARRTHDGAMYRSVSLARAVFHFPWRVASCSDPWCGRNAGSPSRVAVACQYPQCRVAARRVICVAARPCLAGRLPCPESAPSRCL
jgi:hypothetical protein